MNMRTHLMLTLPPTSIRPGDRVSVAISGGADSTALLLLVHAANSQAKNTLGIGLSAVHINHSLRAAESDADQAFVEALCARLQISLHIERVDTAAHAAEHRQTIEEAARNLRYRVFETLIRQGRANIVLTAHTLDDQAETVLMKLLRGAWLEGLGAISPALHGANGDLAGGKILRPLLETRRADLRQYLETLGQPWREDSSNSDEAFTRNRIRATLLPALRQENPSIDRTLANLAELAREEEARWTVELAKLLPQLLLPGKPVRGGGRGNSTQVGEQTLAIELERLKPLDPALRRRVLRATARQLGARLSFDETARLLTLAGFPPNGIPDPTVPSKPGGRLRLAAGLLAERSARELRLTRAPEPSKARPE
jgi:tRNA(Ile)-lysidine synthase